MSIDTTALVALREQLDARTPGNSNRYTHNLSYGYLIDCIDKAVASLTVQPGIRYEYDPPLPDPWPSGVTWQGRVRIVDTQGASGPLKGEK